MSRITRIKDQINEMNPASFQILCDALLCKEGYSGIVCLGAKEGAEKSTPGTPDTYFHTPDGKYIFVEYTTQKDGLVQKIQEDLDKCLNADKNNVPVSEIAQILYFHTSSNLKPGDELRLRKHCKALGVDLVIEGIDSIARKLMAYPVLVKDHLGIELDSGQIQTMEDFIQQYDSTPWAATLETSFLGREKEFALLDNAFETVPGVLLTGPAGVGKTRLALEYGKRHAKQYNETFLCVHSRDLDIYEDAEAYFERPGAYFVLIDDVNQLSEVKLILSYVNRENRGYHVRVLMTVRDYAKEKVRQDIDDVIRYNTVEINPFSDQEIRDLVWNQYGIQNSFYLDRIVELATRNARMAMLLGKIASDKNDLSALNNPEDIYNQYFGKVLCETGIVGEKQVLIAAGIVAFLGKLHLERMAPLASLLDELGLTAADFKAALHRLHDRELVDIHADKVVRISEQCMGNYLVKYVFCDKRLIRLSKMIETFFGSHHEQTVQTINSLLYVFPLPKICQYVKEEVCSLWKKLEADKSPLFSRFWKTFYQMNETAAILILKKQIMDSETVVMDVADIDTATGKNDPSISDDTVDMLGKFAGLESVDTALDLFFLYYLKRPDLYMDFYHAATIHFSLDTDSYWEKYSVQIWFFEKLVEYASKAGGERIDLLFLDLAVPFLGFHFHKIQNGQKRNINIAYVDLADGMNAQLYRNVIWARLEMLSSVPIWQKKIKNLLAGYGQGRVDICKKLVRGEADVICKLANQLFSQDSLEDCLIAMSLARVFARADCPDHGLQPYLQSPKYKIYQLLKGKTRNGDISWDDYYQEKENTMREYLEASNSRTAAFEEMFQLYLESKTLDSRERHLASSGITLALRVLEEWPEEYLHCVKIILASDRMIDSGEFAIVQTLFSMLPPQTVYELLSQCHENTWSSWMYAYYHELPEPCIDEKQVEVLYALLAEEPDIHSQSPRYGSLLFLDKYLDVDPDAYVTASQIITKKEPCSEEIFETYFWELFQKAIQDPAPILTRYQKDVKLLERLYLCYAKSSLFEDENATLLKILFQEDPGFVMEYAEWLVNLPDRVLKEPVYRASILAFYREENFLDIMDFLAVESIIQEARRFWDQMERIKGIINITNTEDALTEKVDQWILHFIDANLDKSEYIVILFETLSELSLEQVRKFLPHLLNRTKDYDIFRRIPLMPVQFSCWGSWVPVYAAWIHHLEKILPLLKGIDFIEHRALVEERITSCQKLMENEELDEIMEG